MVARRGVAAAFKFVRDRAAVPAVAKPHRGGSRRTHSRSVAFARGKSHDVDYGVGFNPAAHRGGNSRSHRIICGAERIGRQVGVACRRGRVLVAEQRAEVWRACKQRLQYKENWIEWDDLRRARRVEAFRTLETKLRQSELAIAAPGGGDWWPGEPALVRRDPELLQARESSEMALLPAPHEGLNLLGTPDYAARPSWLALVPNETGGGQNPPPSAAGDSAAGPFPLWMEAAVRLGTRFWRIAAAGAPPGGAEFAMRAQAGSGACVSCCEACGCEHPPHLDEYYFWLIPGAVFDPKTTTAAAPIGATASGDYQNGYQDDFYDPVQQTSTVWEDPTQLPQLLAWPSSPTVRLAWCRVHNRQFGQPRRSMFAVRVDPPGGSISDLQFLGRIGDSLSFAVTYAVTPRGRANSSAPGFRYDIAADDTVVLPQVAAPASPTYLGALNLPAYPYFLFFAPARSFIRSRRSAHPC